MLIPNTQSLSYSHSKGKNMVIRHILSKQYAAVSIKPMRDGSVDFTVKGSTKGAVKGAITGAGIGAKGGIPGAVAGTIIGGTIGYITGPAD
jgi:outer membrane lipoprotein SlyB